jgi:hypothetical protein
MPPLFALAFLCYKTEEFQEIEIMADSVPQNYANHVRWDPLFHFFALPVVLLT